FELGTFDELKSRNEPLTNTLNLARIDLRRSANGPCRKPLTGDTGASQNTLFDRTQSLELRVNQLIQCVRNTLRNCFNRRCKSPFRVDLRKKSLLHDVLKDGHHE